MVGKHREKGIPMGTTSTLSTTISTTHDDLAARLAAARAMTGRPDDPRLERARIDQFLAPTSQHLHAVYDVLLPRARRCADGRDLVRDHLRAATRLEMLLYHVQAHEYGAATEQGASWPALWDEVEVAMGEERRREEALVRGVTALLDDASLDDLARSLAEMAPHEPTRPHPYLPHRGPARRVSRGLMKAVDAFWDTTQNRQVPRPAPEPRKEPGLLGQYLTGDPRFEPEEEPTE